jgi:hypothetical protein
MCGKIRPWVATSFEVAIDVLEGNIHRESGRVALTLRKAHSALEFVMMVKIFRAERV